MFNDNYEEKIEFINYVRRTLKSNPDWMADCITAMTSGVNDNIEELRQQVSDFETIAVGFQAMSNGRYKESNHKWAESLVLSKLKKHKNHCHINWSSNIEELQKQHDERFSNA